MSADISAFQFGWCDSIANLSAHDWNALTADHPFLQHAWLLAMENSGAASRDTGWQPSHLTVLSGTRLIAAMPLYLKFHSYGEYVFDWSWAEASHQAGIAYYPKLISAIPFSPVSGPRLLMHADCSKEMRDSVRIRVLQLLQQKVNQQDWSGVHILFTDADPDFEQAATHEAWVRRDGVQFRWENPGYGSWELFLQQLSHDKRKKIRQERKKVLQQGVTCEVKCGSHILPEDWTFFYQCYCHTYALHRSQPYLPLIFFLQLAETMAEQLVMFVAYQDGQAVAASLCLYDQRTLYGRYWGSLAEISCLHFELCYYQPQHFCIARGLRYFEGGAQGEHKLARGFVAYPTRSWHWLRHPGLQAAVARFVTLEQGRVAEYVHELDERAPFKQGATLTKE